jgi:hypothetical protein
MHAPKPSDPNTPAQICDPSGERSTLFVVTTVTLDGDGRLVFAELGEYADRALAMSAAKRAAHPQTDGIRYGPASIAYVGCEVTAVVTWATPDQTCGAR